MKSFNSQKHHPKIIQSDMAIILPSEYFPEAKKLVFLLLDLVGLNHCHISHFVPIRTHFLCVVFNKSKFAKHISHDQVVHCLVFAVSLI
jgi:hypothetical protein